MYLFNIYCHVFSHSESFKVTINITHSHLSFFLGKILIYLYNLLGCVRC